MGESAAPSRKPVTRIHTRVRVAEELATKMAERLKATDATGLLKVCRLVNVVDIEIDGHGWQRDEAWAIMEPNHIESLTYVTVKEGDLYCRDRDRIVPARVTGSQPRRWPHYVLWRERPITSSALLHMLEIAIQQMTRVLTVLDDYEKSR